MLSFFKHQVSTLFFFIAILFSSLLHSAAQLAKPKDGLASTYYRDLVHFALRESGYENPAGVRVIAANSSTQLAGFIDLGHASDVTHTVMMNEHALEKYDPYMAIVNAFHEAAHMVKNHQAQATVRAQLFKTGQENCKKAAQLSLNRLVRVDEMEAELFAVQTLMRLQKKWDSDCVWRQRNKKHFKGLMPEDVVTARLSESQRCIDEGKGDITDGVHPTFEQFLECVEPFVQALKKGHNAQIDYYVRAYKRAHVQTYVNRFNRCMQHAVCPAGQAT